MDRLIGIFGIIAILLIAYIFSNNRKKINFKLILWGISLQVFFAVLILKVPGGKFIFRNPPEKPDLEEASARVRRLFITAEGMVKFETKRMNRNRIRHAEKVGG